MDLEEEINNILFEMVKEIKLHRVDNENTVIEVDYNKYTVHLLRLFKNYLAED
jgi:hemerythrin